MCEDNRVLVASAPSALPALAHLLARKASSPAAKENAAFVLGAINGETPVAGIGLPVLLLLPLPPPPPAAGLHWLTATAAAACC